MAYLPSARMHECMSVSIWVKKKKNLSQTFRGNPPLLLDRKQGFTAGNAVFSLVFGPGRSWRAKWANSSFFFSFLAFKIWSLSLSCYLIVTHQNLACSGSLPKGLAVESRTLNKLQRLHFSSFFTFYLHSRGRLKSNWIEGALIFQLRPRLR